MCECPYWVTPRIGGCHLVCLDEILVLAEQGVSIVVSLVESYELLECWQSPLEYEKALVEAGMRVYRLPTPDGGSPDPDDACKVFREIAVSEQAGGKTVFHCYAGLGRTGTLIAAYLIAAHGASLEEAVGAVRRACSGAGPSTSEQLYFLQYVERECRGILGERG